MISNTELFNASVHGIQITLSLPESTYVESHVHGISSCTCCIEEETPYLFSTWYGVRGQGS